MAQFRKDVYNLAPGVGQAIDDPRVGEELARNADARAAQELALRRQAQAQQQALAQRQMALSEQAASFEQSLASQARGGGGNFRQASDVVRDQDAARGPMQGRDAMMRDANNAAAQEKQFRYQMNAGLDLDKVFGQAGLVDGRQGMGPVGTARLPEDAGSTGELDRGAWIDRTGAARGGNAGYNRGGGVSVHAAGYAGGPGGGEVLQAGRMSADEAMAEAMGLEDRSFARGLQDRKMSAEEFENYSVDRARQEAGALGRDTLNADVAFKDRGQTEVERQNNWQRSFTEKESEQNWTIRRTALAQEAQKIKSAADAQAWSQKFAESEAMRQEEQRHFERRQGALNNSVQRDVTMRQADREDQAQTFQLDQARQMTSDADKQAVFQFVTSDEDILTAVNSGVVSSEAAIKLELFKGSNPRYGPMIDALLSGPNVQKTAREAGDSFFRPRSSDPTGFINTDREMRGRAQNRFNQGLGVDFPEQPGPPPTRWERRLGELPDLGRAADQVSARIQELIFGPAKRP